MNNKRILLGVSGGIAAYKAAELVRLLTKRGAEVRVVMTAAAQQFVTPLTFQALSGHPVHTNLFDAGQEQAMSHIHLARWADTLVIAPATANTIATLANGLGDDLLSTLNLSAECPVLIAPAMNQAMWRKAVTQENISRLRQHGVQFIGPEAGAQACGELGLGRMSEPEIICQQVLGDLQPGILQGVQITITAGPTREPLDPVRFISNRSSGKMGYALALAAATAGADVTLISGPVNLPAPAGVKLVSIETAQQMYETVMAEIAQTQIFIGTAAVADYRPAQIQERKIKKQQDDDSYIELLKNPDIIASVANLPTKPFTVGFAAETHDVEAYALGKLHAKKLDMIAANQVGQTEGGFDSDQNSLQVYWRDGQQILELTDKQRLAGQLLELVAREFYRRETSSSPNV